tara:strand:- start:2700 stop:3254 length:555 start_codon:yes stop_codon:yes gene_type:complete
MAVLSDVYKTKNNREITLTAFQALVFDAVIRKFKIDGVGGDDIFEETYVLQKMIAEYITSNKPKSGNTGDVRGQAVECYNAILGIVVPVVSAPQPDPIEDPIADEIIQPDVTDLVKITKDTGIKGGGKKAIVVKDESKAGIDVTTAAGKQMIKTLQKASSANKRKKKMKSFKDLYMKKFNNQVQ